MTPEHARNVLAHREAGTPILAGTPLAEKRFTYLDRW